MSAPLLWVPIFDAQGPSEAFWEWKATRFVSSHGGIAHVIADRIGDWPSMETHVPVNGAHWYWVAGTQLPKRVRPQDAAVEIQLPVGTGPDLEQLEKIASQVTIRRLVVRRPAAVSLGRIRRGLLTLGEALKTDLWLHLDSFGWEAASYLLAAQPDLQLWGVSDPDLWKLVRLSALTQRPLLQADFSGRPPRPLRPLPRYDDEKGADPALRSLPIWRGSR